MHTRALLLVAVATQGLAQTPVSIRPPAALLVPRARPERPTTLPEKVEPSQLHLAVPLDQAGRLEEALPLYRARAEQTQTSADRLRYAGALLRSGQADEAARVFDGLVAEGQLGPHHARSSVELMLCASTMLREGFPELAVARLRPVYRPSADTRRLGLLLVRALAAAGDPAGARSVLGNLGAGLDTWEPSELIELARGNLLAGNPAAARALLDREIPESVGHMMRDSILADMRLLDGDWAGAAKLLADGKRKGPPGLDEEHVNRTWRNVQRELRSMQLRLGLSLWKQGKPDAAMEEIAQAATSDEESVRSQAVLLAVAGDLVEHRRDAALRRLGALGGHDRRFKAGAEKATAEIAAGRDPVDGLRVLGDALASQDRSAASVAGSVVGVLQEAARPAGAEDPKRADAR
jgi:thioredoxin-like negative regulator of GroEL